MSWVCCATDIHMLCRAASNIVLTRLSDQIIAQGWLFFTDFAIVANMVLKISVVADLRHMKMFKIDVKPSIFRNFSAF